MKKPKSYPDVMSDDMAVIDKSRPLKTVSNKCKKKSLNLASYHESVSSNFTPSYVAGAKYSRPLSRFDKAVIATKAARKRHKKRGGNRRYLHECPGEYCPVVKTEKTREVRAAIRFPHPKSLSAVEIEERFTFRFNSEGREYTKSQALAIVSKKFFRWCNARGFAQGDKVSIVTLEGDFHFIAEHCPDMRIKPTKSVSNCA